MTQTASLLLATGWLYGNLATISTPSCDLAATVPADQFGRAKSPRAATGRSAPDAPTPSVRHSACDVSFPLRVGFDEHPLMLDGRVSLFGEGSSYDNELGSSASRHPSRSGWRLESRCLPL